MNLDPIGTELTAQHADLRLMIDKVLNDALLCDCAIVAEQFSG